MILNKKLYEEVIDLRNRISMDGEDIIYQEDHLVLDKVLDLLENDKKIKNMKFGDLLSVIDYGTFLSVVLDNNYGSFALWGEFLNANTIKDLKVLSNFEVGLVSVIEKSKTNVKELSIRLTDKNA